MEVKKINKNLILKNLNAHNLNFRPDSFNYLFSYLKKEKKGTQELNEIIKNIIDFQNLNNEKLDFIEYNFLFKIINKKNEIDSNIRNDMDEEINDTDNYLYNEIYKYLIFKSNFENHEILFNERFKMVENKIEKNIFNYDKTKLYKYKLELFRNFIKKSNNFYLESSNINNYGIEIKELGSIKTEENKENLYTYGIFGKDIYNMTLENEMSIINIEFDSNYSHEYYIDLGQILIVRGRYINTKFIIESIIMLDKLIFSNENLNLINKNEIPFRDIYCLQDKFEYLEKTKINNFIQKNIFIINNFDLSNSITLNNFDIFTQRYCKSIGILIIVGPFWNNFFINNKIEHNKFNTKLNIFGKLLQKYLVSKIILVPDINELGNKFLPRISLPNKYFNDLLKYNENIIFGENPCKFTIFGKNIYIIKENFCKILSKKRFIKLKDEMINSDFLFNTILGQRSVIGNSNSFSIHSNYEDQLLITAFPDFLILCDDNSLMSSKIDQNNNSILNTPGNFSKKNTFIKINLDKENIEELKLFI